VGQLSQAAIAIPGGLGRRGLEALAGLGRATLYLLHMVRAATRPRPRLILEHLRFIGNRSVGLVLLTSAFTGMVLCLQGDSALRRFGSQRYVGPMVALGLIRELGPVLSALMVTARAGSAIAAAIGSMRVSEQIEALESMAIDPVNFLATPRLVAALIAVPLLGALFSVTGIGTGYLFGTTVLHLDGNVFLGAIHDTVGWSDVRTGLWKSVAFAVLIAWICTFRGYRATRGALGVGQATSQAVVETSALILMGDYVLTALLF
jgi:phospholipid/cholesterol/gamma-HCH transport system permease protein